MAKEKQTQPDTEIIEGETAVKAAPRYVVSVTSASARRRAGFAFGPTPVHLTEADLNDEKIKALKADPLLSFRPYEPEEDDKE